MADHIKEKIDFIVYTSAIEHMQYKDGKKSLQECGKVAKKGAYMFLSCPNTPEDQDGFDVQYKAHVYEWKLSELRKEVSQAGFLIQQEIGLIGNLNDFKKNILDRLPSQFRKWYDDLIDYIPREFLTPMLFVSSPSMAKEVLLICRKK